MNGDQHFRKAEELLLLLADPRQITGMTTASAANAAAALGLLAAQAQAHASLALAAYTKESS